MTHVSIDAETVENHNARQEAISKAVETARKLLPPF
jgi:hypothetical protein